MKMFLRELGFILVGAIPLLGCLRQSDEREPPDAALADSTVCRGLGNCALCEKCGPCTGAPPEIATSCSPRPDSPVSGWPPSDECECDAGTCPAGKTCVRVFRRPPSGAGGPGGNWNICAELCSGDSDCGAGRVCRPNVHGIAVCATPSCRSDADCTADRCGHCMPGLVPVHGGAVIDPSNSELRIRRRMPYGFLRRMLGGRAERANCPTPLPALSGSSRRHRTRYEQGVRR
jgi:hypothetical protein